jgi:hypothetical protein
MMSILVNIWFFNRVLNSLFQKFNLTFCLTFYSWNQKENSFLLMLFPSNWYFYFLFDFIFSSLKLLIHLFYFFLTFNIYFFNTILFDSFFGFSCSDFRSSRVFRMISFLYILIIWFFSMWIPSFWNILFDNHKFISGFRFSHSIENTFSFIFLYQNFWPSWKLNDILEMSCFRKNNFFDENATCFIKLSETILFYITFNNQ